jgi:hypothetical protein
MDAMGRNGRGVALFAVIALAAAFAYSLGLQHGADAARQSLGDMPIEPKTVLLMRDAASRARAEGDVASADWFEEVAQQQMEQMVAWATRARDARPAARGD